LRPFAPPRNRTAQIAGLIADEIAQGCFTRGAKLPTEPDMIEAMRVSRTVIRESVAALRAEGLVVTRQGLDAFVSTDRRRQPFRMLPEAVTSVADVLDIMELRMAVETEISGLAAERESQIQLRAVARRLEGMMNSQERYRRLAEAAKLCAVNNCGIWPSIETLLSQGDADLKQVRSR